jgi:hypothetical protein
VAAALTRRRAAGGGVAVPLLLLCAGTACGRLDRECRAFSTRANSFIADGAGHRPKPDASPADTAREALATASRYDRLAADLAALDVQSSELRPEVDAYRALAERSATSLRDVAKALGDNDFDTARRKRVELDTAAKGEGPLVAKINAICGLAPSPAPSGAASAR